MRGTQHSPEVKAAVLAALMTGQGVDSVARQYNLHRSTVKNWKRQINGGVNPVNPQKTREDYSELLDVYVRENLKTLAEQQQHFRNTEWLDRQSAADVAVLHGVSADKAVRILEAAERAAGGPDEPAP